MSEPITTARVTLTVEITVKSAWSDRAHLHQVWGQASLEAKSMLLKELKPTDVRILGEPVVVAVMCSDRNGTTKP